MEISHVIRGEDHISNTPKHILLFRALGHAEPGLRPPAPHPQRRPDEDEQAQDPDGGLRLHRPGLHPRGAHQLPGAPRLVHRLGGGDPLASTRSPPASTSTTSRRAAPSSTASASSGSTASGSGASRTTTWSLASRPFLEAEHVAGRIDRMPTTEEIRTVLPMIRERLPTLGAVGDLIGFLWVDDLRVDAATIVPKRWDAATTARGRCAAARETIAAVGEVSFEAEELEPPLRALAEARGWKAGDLFMAIRVAVTGRTATPPLFDTLVALGRDRTLARLDAAIATLGTEAPPDPTYHRTSSAGWTATSPPGRATTKPRSPTSSAPTPSTATIPGTSRSAVAKPSSRTGSRPAATPRAATSRARTTRVRGLGRGRQPGGGRGHSDYFTDETRHAGPALPQHVSPRVRRRRSLHELHGELPARALRPALRIRGSATAAPPELTNPAVSAKCHPRWRYDEPAGHPRHG